MAKNTQLTDATANAAADAVARLLDGGFIDIYDNTNAQPANADTAVPGTSVKLARIALANPSAPAAVAGVVTFTDPAPVNPLASGTALWFRALKSDGVTAVYDGTIGVTANSFNLVLGTTTITVGTNVDITSATYTAQKATAGL